MNFNFIDNLSEKGTKNLLKELIIKLDELDCHDYFGTKGWKKFLGFEK